MHIRKPTNGDCTQRAGVEGRRWRETIDLEGVQRKSVVGPGAFCNALPPRKNPARKGSGSKWENGGGKE